MTYQPTFVFCGGSSACDPLPFHVSSCKQFIADYKSVRTYEHMPNANQHISKNFSNQLGKKTVKVAYLQQDFVYY